MTIAEEILAAAEGELGVHEDPMGSNRGKRVGYYQSLDWLGGGGYPWCVCFAWCFVVWHEAVGRPNPYPTASVAQLSDWAYKNGWTVSGPIVPGDLLCLNYGQHVTIAAKRPANGYVRCIGGNQSDSVCYKDYKVAEVTTIIRVPKRFGTANPTKPPRYEVVRGEGEKSKVVFTGALGKAQKVAGNVLRAGARVVRIRKK